MGFEATTPPAIQGRRERKRQRMASHIATTAFELFEALGYDAVTMEQIAAEADVAKATLYSYFPMKEALVAHRFKDEIVAGMDGLEQRLAAEPSFASRMDLLLRESAAWHVARRGYLAYYLRYLNSPVASGDAGPDADTASSVTWRILAGMFRAAQQHGEISNAVPAERLGWYLEFLLYGAITRWLAQPDIDLADEFRLVFGLLMTGVEQGK